MIKAIKRFFGNTEEIDELTEKVSSLLLEINELYRINDDRGTMIFEKNSQIQEKNREIKELQAALESKEVINDEQVEKLVSLPIGSWQERLVVSNHAISRYKERINLKLSNDDIYRKIKKMFVKQFINMDKIDDGTYTLEKNVTCRIKDNTITTITYRQGLDRQKFRQGRSLASANFKNK